MTRELIEIMNSISNGTASQEQLEVLSKTLAEIHRYCRENGFEMPPLGLKKRKKPSKTDERTKEVWQLMNSTEKYGVTEACQIVADRHKRELSSIRKPFDAHMNLVGHLKITNHGEKS